MREMRREMRHEQASMRAALEKRMAQLEAAVARGGGGGTWASGEVGHGDSAPNGGLPPKLALPKLGRPLSDEAPGADGIEAALQA